MGNKEFVMEMKTKQPTYLESARFEIEFLGKITRKEGLVNLTPTAHNEEGETVSSLANELV